MLGCHPSPVGQDGGPWLRLPPLGSWSPSGTPSSLQLFLSTLVSRTHPTPHSSTTDYVFLLVLVFSFLWFPFVLYQYTRYGSYWERQLLNWDFESTHSSHTPPEFNRSSKWGWFFVRVLNGRKWDAAPQGRQTCVEGSRCTQLVSGRKGPLEFTGPKKKQGHKQKSYSGPSSSTTGWTWQNQITCRFHQQPEQSLEEEV